MMHVEVQVPMLDTSYEFELDGKRETGLLIGEMISLIEQKEQVIYDRREKPCLYAWGQECILNGSESLAGQGIRNGDQLLLL